MRCEIVAVGTELLLGQTVDTNSAWLAERLAAHGIDCHFHTTVGDNVERIASVLRAALARNDAVVVCGGLGPTQDDVTRQAVAEVAGVPLERDEEVLARIRRMFEDRGREMAPSNARQADVPRGAVVIPQTRGTAPGLVVEVGGRTLYAVPGVPEELRDMVERAVLPDLAARAGTRSTIVSRMVRTWGLAESTLAERVAPRLAALDRAGGNPTLAFLAGGVEGIRIRITAKAASREAALAMVEAEDAELRAILGTLVVGVDDDTMEGAVGALLEDAGLTLGLAESMTGGLVASRLVTVPGSSAWFRGSVVAYQSQVKFDLLGVPEGPVVCEEAAAAMAEGAAKVLGADVGLSVTGVAGPAEQEQVPVGTAFFGLCLDGRTEVSRHRLPGDRDRIRQFATLSMLDLLRRRLLERLGPTG
ncbi:MAG TPA: competence/damage-inducible protein A [Acidimicrobiales bacterium]|nr:competence/damage-inducible protein A [Acidimicrobiales bacterium]